MMGELQPGIHRVTIQSAELRSNRRGDHFLHLVHADAAGDTAREVLLLDRTSLPYSEVVEIAHRRVRAVARAIGLEGMPSDAQDFVGGELDIQVKRSASDDLRVSMRDPNEPPPTYVPNDRHYRPSDPPRARTRLGGRG